MSGLFKYDIGDMVQIDATVFPSGFPTKLGGIYAITYRSSKEPDGQLEPGGHYYGLDGHDNMLVNERDIIKLVRSGSEINRVGDAIEAHLRQKQAKKEYKDIGRKKGTAKERRAYDKVLGSNLDDIEEDAVQAEKLVTKKKVWETLDVQRERDMGTSSGGAYLKFKLHGALAAKPINSKAARSVYVRALELLQLQLDDARSYDAVLALVDSFFRMEVFRERFPEIDTVAHGKHSYSSQMSRFAGSLDNTFGKVFMNVVNNHSDSAANIHAQSKLFEAFTQEQEEAYREKMREAVKPRMQRYNDYLKGLNEAQTINDVKRAMDEQWKGSPSRWKTDFQSARSGWIRTVNNWIAQANPENIRDRYKARPEDWSWAAQTKEKRTTTVDDGPRINTYPFLSRIVRKNGIVVTEKANAVLNTTWGLKAVQYGNSLTDAESEHLTWHTNMALTDLRELLGTDIARINKLGSLGLDFATRGTSGAAATYYSAYAVINLTKKWGDGSLAHEWAHYLDNVLGANIAPEDMEKVNGSLGSFATVNGARDPEVNRAISDIMRFIRMGSATETTTKLYTAKNHRFYKQYVDKRGTLEEDIAYTRANQPHLFKPSYHDAVHEHLLYLHGIEKMELKVRLGSSYQFAESSKPESKYWVKDVELFARAFEGYVMHLMEERGMQSDFLQASRKFYRDRFVGFYPYPHNTDMDYLRPMFDRLFAVIRKQFGIDEWQAPVDAPRITMEVDNTSLTTTDGPSIEQKQAKADDQEAKAKKIKMAKAFAFAAKARIQLLKLAA